MPSDAVKGRARINKPQEIAEQALVDIMDNAPSRLYSLIEALPSGLQDHLYRTREVALDLASRHNVDAQKVALAALGHDLYRAMSGSQLLEQAHAVGLAVHPVEQQVPILLHGPLAAQLLKQSNIISDPEVLEGIHWHSIACAGLGKVGLVVFLADKLDPHKAKRIPRFQRLAEVAQESLEKATIDYLTWELGLLLKRGSLLHPASVKARNHLMMQIAKQGGGEG